ncbi:MAG TPA: hypothetical protein VJU86_06330 [Pyrinomonadaceae bacterium]|nr:hypothetical protein [Pyrinomonadaceae bacterium]
MKTNEAAQKVKELHSVEADLRKLADYLQQLPSRQRELSARTDGGLTALQRKIHESKIEAGQLLNKAVALGGFESKKGLRRVLASKKFRANPDYGYASAFEDICLKWIPKQPDGFDFTWKRKQVGELETYASALRYLADGLVTPGPSQRKSSAAS